MNHHERADHLFDRAKKLGLDAPTLDMVAAAIQDAECDALTIPMTVAQKSCGWEDGGLFLKAVRTAVGTLAEQVATDLDHHGLRHRKWFQAVNKVRKYVQVEDCQP